MVRSGESAIRENTGLCVFNANLPYALLSSFMTFWCPVIVMVTVYYRVFRSSHLLIFTRYLILFRICKFDQLMMYDVNAANIPSCSAYMSHICECTNIFDVTLVLRCRSAVKQKTSMAMATVNLPTVNGYAR